MGAVVGAIAWTVLVMLPVSSGWPLWWCVRPGLHAWFLAKFCIIAYAGLRVLELDILGFHSLSKLVEWKSLVFQPYHPDGAGGLLDIGRYRLAFVYALMGTSAYMAASAMRETVLGFVPEGAVLGPLNMGDIIVYAICLLMIPLSFFLPVWTVHWFMEREKTRLSATLARTVERDLEHASQLDSLPEPGDVERLAQTVGSLKNLTDIPEWPINGAVLRRFAGSWLSLAVSPLVGKLIDVLVRLP
jgi:hypothetical protein